MERVQLCMEHRCTIPFQIHLFVIQIVRNGHITLINTKYSDTSANE